MAEKMKSKFVYFGDVIFDITADTITADKLLTGFTAHDAAGNAISGTCDYDVNSQDATVKVAEMLSGSTAYARGTKLQGTMPNNGAVHLTINTLNDVITIPQGYHDGSGTVQIVSDEQAKILARYIMKGITILGVQGELEPSSSVKVHAKTVTPGKTAQTVLPDSGYDFLSQVNVAAIPYVETENAAGGITVTIG